MQRPPAGGVRGVESAPPRSGAPPPASDSRPAPRAAACCRAVARSRDHIGVARQQQLGNFQMTEKRRQMQRRPSVAAEAHSPQSSVSSAAPRSNSPAAQASKNVSVAPRATSRFAISSAGGRQRLGSRFRRSAPRVDHRRLRRHHRFDASNSPALMASINAAAFSGMLRFLPCSLACLCRRTHVRPRQRHHQRRRALERLALGSRFTVEASRPAERRQPALADRHGDPGSHQRPRGHGVSTGSAARLGARGSSWTQTVIARRRRRHQRKNGSGSRSCCRRDSTRSDV